MKKRKIVIKKRGNNLITVKYVNISSLKICAKWIKKLVETILKKENKNNLEINVIITNDKYIKKINKEYRYKNQSTDVISFSYNSFFPGRKLILFGDIIISLDTAKKQALEYGHSLEKETAILLIHGLYHLMGYNHYRKKEYRLMKQKEENAIKMSKIC
ncbi:MAG: rRNA maturation RNase YbeY [Candidatus Firestonebacteria bacterium]